MRPASDTATRKVDKEAMFTARRDVSPLLGGVKGTPLTRAQEVGCVPHPTRNVDKEAMFTARRDVSPLLGGVSSARLAAPWGSVVSPSRRSLGE